MLEDQIVRKDVFGTQTETCEIRFLFVTMFY